MTKPSHTVIFLGAGAAADANIPTARGMTRVMLEAVATRPESIRIQHAVRLAVASIIFGQGVRNEDITQDVNIEEVFNLLDTLSERHQLEASPLIGAWHPVIEELDLLTVGGKIHRSAESSILESFNSRENARKIAETLQQMISQPKSPFPGASDLAQALERVLNPNSSFRRLPKPPEPLRQISGQGQVFNKAKQFLLAELRNHVYICDSRDLSYLDILVKWAHSHHATIATLNYDNSIELVAGRLGIKLDSGLTMWRDKGEMGSVEPDAVRFRKLHGSITWSRVSEPTNPRYPLPRELINEASESDLKRVDYRPALIFGGRNKLTVEGPFLELLRDFRESLNHSRHLIVIGYSFADAHVNEILNQWLNKFEDATVTIVNSPSFSNNMNRFARQLTQVPGGRVTNTGKGAKEGISELFKEP